MTAQDSVTLLAAWDRGTAQIPVERALTLLSAAYPERSREAWAHASIGERDSALLALREELFGTHLNAVAECPRCGAKLELSFSTSDLKVAPAELPRRIAAAGYEVAFRLPTSADLLALPPASDGAALLARCIDSATRDGVAVEANELDTEAQRAVAQAMADADPAADVHVELACPDCAAVWPMNFDILTFLWSEIDDWAQRLLGEVHVLASAYGWTEREIVTLSPRRREFYLNLVGA